MPIALTRIKIHTAIESKTCVAKGVRTLESEKLRLINNNHLLIALYIPVLSTRNIPISSICKLRQDFSKPLEDRLIIRWTFVRTILFNHDFYDWFGGTRFRSSKTHFRLSKRKTHQTHQLTFYSLDLLLHLGEQKSLEKRRNVYNYWWEAKGRRMRKSLLESKNIHFKL